ncbi:MAG: tRNA (N(6)-L-threonylcarbamoyladenosine(37)-C(2))-methylthiotransferase MtaB [Cytophagales bacterium]|nr:tRNA (N(6)-L-threonylcarbamoyladenosine(37)-C(2))-methylthiotransferase MtaB [Bernardetiaceae bacterium]MDW8210219.1 tRNA (N(6)-L-threonylcarbamoyladenosine(37)-C(2))-methylthiotransferase MtaB [Cytophagales bacterium]
MKKVAFYTLGCKLNFSETSTIARMFEQRGYKKVDFTDQPDIFIINTCSVTENADKKCQKVVKEARKIAPNAYIAVIGCYAQLKPNEIAALPGVDAVLGAAEKFRLLDLLEDFKPSGKAQVFASPIEKANLRFDAAYSYGDRTRTFLKVQDGCNYHCSFCTIPLARGASRSDTPENILAKVHQIAATGQVREIVLTGVNTGDYGIINGKRIYKLIDLLTRLETVEGIARFRISSIEPNLLSDEIIDFVAQSKKFAPHFHIPLQSGSDRILALMRRRYRRQLYAERIARIKSLMPHCCIGVDVIVGFPGESNEDFLQTYHFLSELDISYLHVFTYSERANTPASTMAGRVPERVRSERSHMLHILSDKKRRYFYQQNIGRKATVLFEDDIEEGNMHGFTENYIRVSAKYDPLLIGEMKTVQMTAINDKGYMEVCEPVPAEEREFVTNFDALT